MRVGANLVQKTSYKNKYGTLRYKTDIVGKVTTSSGQLMSTYKHVLPVPRPSMGANYSQSGVAELPPSKDMRSYWQWHPKSQDGRFTNYDSSLRGKWMLFYPQSDIDGTWQLIKDLFDTGELRGVSMQRSLQQRAVLEILTKTAESSWCIVDRAMMQSSC